MATMPEAFQPRSAVAPHIEAVHNASGWLLERASDPPPLLHVPRRSPMGRSKENHVLVSSQAPADVAETLTSMLPVFARERRGAVEGTYRELPRRNIFLSFYKLFFSCLF